MSTRNRLSRELVLSTALELVDRDGASALSMRRLAQELDVWPMAVYRYFRDKDELTAALVDAAADRIEAPRRGSWRERLVALLRDARAALDADGAAARDRLADVALPILGEAGLDDRAWRILFGYAIGFAGSDEDFDAGLDLLLDGLAR